MDNNDRRDFVRKMGLFSGLCLTGIPVTYSKTYFSYRTDGMILRASEGETWYIGNERKAEVTIKVAKSEDYTPEISLLTERIPSGDGIPVHKHLNEEEFIFIQEGRVEITLDEAVQEGKTGDLVYVPKNTWHGFKNIGQKVVTILFGYSPAGMEDYFRAIGTKNIDDKLGFTAEDWIRTNQKFGVVYKE
ncbi:MAG: cupin domain-containing protein [Bacteroidota bacterium]